MMIAFCSVGVSPAESRRTLIPLWRAALILINVVLILLLASLASAESMYTSFVPQGTMAIEKKDVSLKLEKEESAVTEFFLVDTAFRSQQILQHPAGRRAYILLFDLIYMNAEEVIKARKIADTFLSKRNADDLIAIGAITKQEGLKFYSDLTNDRNKLVTALNDLGQSLIIGAVEGPDGNIYPADFTKQTESVALLDDATFLANLKLTETKKKEAYSPLYVQSLTDLTSLISILHGRKNILLFSPGTDVKGLSMNLPIHKPGEKTDDKEPAKPETPQSTAENAATPPPDFETLITPRPVEERSAGGPSGIPTRKEGADIVIKLLAGTDAHFFVFDPATEESRFLKELSKATAGMYFQNGDVSVLDPILNSDKKFYVVGWNGEPEKGFTALRSIKVAVGQQELAEPHSWLAPKIYSDYKALEKKAHVAEGVYKNFNASPAGIRIWADFLFDEQVDRIPVFTAISGSEMLSEKNTRANWEFSSFLLKPDGSVVDFASSKISMDLHNPQLREQLKKGGVKVWGILLSQQGPVSIRSVIVNAEDGKTITQTLSLNFQDAAATISVPFFPDYNLNWITWPKVEEKTTKRGFEVQYPYIYGTNYFFPDLFPVISKTDKQRAVYFKIYNVPQHPPVHIQLIGNGGTHELSDFALMFQPNPVAKNGSEVFWTLKSFPVLPPGSYQFRVNVATGDGNALQREIPIELR